MNTQNFQNLIQKITGRPFIINTTDAEIINGKEYFVGLTLPLTGSRQSFKWKAALTDEKLLRSFITAFCTKYREPNPASYDYSAKIYGESALYKNMTEIQKEYAYNHHATHMYSKDQLMKQIEDNFSSNDMQSALIKYGFYSTEYGVGIFCFWQTAAVNGAIQAMANYLNGVSIPFANEFSDARWVFRFKLGLSKDNHTALLNSFAA